MIMVLNAHKRILMHVLLILSYATSMQGLMYPYSGTEISPKKHPIGNELAGLVLRYLVAV